MSIYGHFLESSSIRREETQGTREKTDLLSIKSKIQSVNNYIESLLQKKIRLDLEIKRQKKTLSKLNKKAKTEFRFSVELERELERPLSQEQKLLLEDKIESYYLLKDLQNEIRRSDSLIQEILNLEESGQIMDI